MILASTFFEILANWRLKDRKSPIFPTVTLKPWSGVTQDHWFWYQWKTRVYTFLL